MKIIIKNYEFEVDEANSFKKRFWGLIGKKEIKKGLFFPNTGSIHTFFMKENIDIIMLDKKMKIILIKKAFPKNKILINLKAKYTIELPQNSIKEIMINDLVTIKTIPN